MHTAMLAARSASIATTIAPSSRFAVGCSRRSLLRNYSSITHTHTWPRATRLLSFRTPHSVSSARPLATAATAPTALPASTSPAAPLQAHTPAPAPSGEVPPGTYAGPLTNTFRRLKLFSLSSLTLSFAVAPFMFIIESGLPLAARFALAGTALATSGASTALVAWCGRPYVTTLVRLPGGGGVQLTTLTLALHERNTRVYDTAFLADTKRPFAKWELAEALTVAGSPAQPIPEAGTEETVAETFDAKSGAVVGRWIVKWGENGVGACRESGKVVRYFNVHEELLDGPIR